MIQVLLNSIPETKYRGLKSKTKPTHHHCTVYSCLLRFTAHIKKIKSATSRTKDVRAKKYILKYAKNKRSFAMMLAHYYQWKNMMNRRVFLLPLGRTEAIKDNTLFTVNDSMMDNQL